MIRISQLDIQEHTENVGGTNVTIEPQYQSVIQEAVDFINSRMPEVLSNVSDIFGNVENSGVFGEYKTNLPNSVSVDINRIEDEVRNKMQGSGEDEIKSEIKKQIVLTIVHEAKHLQEFNDTGQSSESGPEQEEQRVTPMLDQISCRDIKFKK